MGTGVGATEPEALEHGRHVVVDVREPEEYRSGHVPGAVNIPLGELERRAGELPAGRPVVAYCNLRHPGQARCERAVALLRARGVQATLLAGGFSAWQAEGRPVARG